MTAAVLTKMPRPWFRAQSISSTMMFLTRPGDAAYRIRPLTEGERALGWFVLPPFQRPPLWTEAQKVRFIESAWGGLPIGAFVVNRPNSYNSRFDNWLLDGQQRVTAVLEYVADAFPVGGYLWSELTEIDHRQWDMGVSFPCMETKIENEAELREIYDRLAYGGTPHEPKA